jgi:hypothetical protein
MSAEKSKQKAARPEEKSFNANPNKWIFIGIFAGIVAIFLLLAGVVAVVVVTNAVTTERAQQEILKREQSR